MVTVGLLVSAFASAVQLAALPGLFPMSPVGGPLAAASWKEFLREGQQTACALRMAESDSDWAISGDVLVFVPGSGCSPGDQATFVDIVCRLGLGPSTRIAAEGLVPVAASGASELLVFKDGRLVDVQRGIGDGGGLALVHVLIRNGLVAGSLESLEAERRAISSVDQLPESLEGLALSFVVLDGARLSGKNMRGARLSAVRMRGADLREANLRDAILSHVDLGEALLAGADLRNARAFQVRCPNGDTITGPLVCPGQVPGSTYRPSGE